MWAKYTPIISSTHSKATTTFPLIGKDDATSGLPCSGTTATVPSASPCQATAKKLDNVSITQSLPNPNSSLIPARHAPTAANNNYVPLLTLHQHWESNKRPSYRKSLEFSFIMLGQLTAPCLRPLALWQHNRPTLQRPPWTGSTNFWTMPYHTPTPASRIEQVT